MKLGGYMKQQQLQQIQRARQQKERYNQDKGYEMKYTDHLTLKYFVKSILRKEGLRQTEVAKQLSMSKQSLYKLLNKKTFNFEDLKKLCDILDYDLVITLKKKEKEK